MTDDERGRVEKVAMAMCNAVIRDDEGEFPRLFDMLGYSGENKCWTVVRELARVAIAAMREGEQKREGEARAAVPPDVPYDATYMGSSVGWTYEKMRTYGKKADEYRQRAEAAESLAQAEREQRENEAAAYGKEIEQLRAAKAGADSVAAHWKHLACDPQTRENINREMEKERDEARARASELATAIERGGLDLSPCRSCSCLVACIPDGLPYCDRCAAAEEKRQQGEA